MSHSTAFSFGDAASEAAKLADAINMVTRHQQFQQQQQQQLQMQMQQQPQQMQQPQQGQMHQQPQQGQMHQQPQQGQMQMQHQMQVPQHQQQQYYGVGTGGPGAGNPFATSAQSTQEQLDHAQREVAALKATLSGKDGFSSLLPSPVGLGAGAKQPATAQKGHLDFDGQQKSSACFSWLNKGTCHRGEYCSFKHDQQTKPKTRHPGQRAQTGYDGTVVGTRTHASKRLHEAEEEDDKIRKLQHYSRQDREDIKILYGKFEKLESWMTQPDYNKVKSDAALGRVDAPILFKRMTEAEKSIEENMKKPDAMLAANAQFAPVREENRRWFIDAVNKIHQEAHEGRRSSYDDTGGNQGHLPLRELDAESAWYLAVLTLAVDTPPVVTVTAQGGNPVRLGTAYKGRPHTDPNYEGAQLVYQVFASPDPFPEGGKIDVLEASSWCRTFLGPPNMSLRACLRAVRDLFDVCAVCNDKDQDGTCTKCRYKGHRPESPRFSPISPGKLPEGVQPFPASKTD